MIMHTHLLFNHKQDVYMLLLVFTLDCIQSTFSNGHKIFILPHAVLDSTQRMQY